MRLVRDAEGKQRRENNWYVSPSRLFLLKVRAKLSIPVASATETESAEDGICIVGSISYEMKKERGLR